MLGQGRPFVLQLVNPKKRATVTVEQLRDIQDLINKSTLVGVNNLTFGSEKDFLSLKESEETKVKVYCCVVETSKIIPASKIAELNQLKDLKVDQKTPLRVLHRRSNKHREKIAHSLYVHPITDYSYLVFVFSSAGMYIKEFIHGDFGR